MQQRDRGTLNRDNSPILSKSASLQYRIGPLAMVNRQFRRVSTDSGTLFLR